MTSSLASAYGDRRGAASAAVSPQPTSSSGAPKRRRASWTTVPSAASARISAISTAWTADTTPPATGER